VTISSLLFLLNTEQAFQHIDIASNELY